MSKKPELDKNAALQQELEQVVGGGYAEDVLAARVELVGRIELDNPDGQLRATSITRLGEANLSSELKQRILNGES